jgi:ribosomal protein S27AE
VKMERWIRLQNDEIVRDIQKNKQKIEEIGVLNKNEFCPECGNETIGICPHCDFAGIKSDNDNCPVCKHPIIVYEDENENK